MRLHTPVALHDLAVLIVTGFSEIGKIGRIRKHIPTGNIPSQQIKKTGLERLGYEPNGCSTTGAKTVFCK